MPRGTKIRFFADTPAGEVIAVMKQLLPTDAKCDRDKALAFHNNIAAANGTALDMARSTPNQFWACWSMRVMGAECSPELRKASIGVITDPMLAFGLYLDLPFLTNEEDRLLEAKFKGKLPTAEQELASGVVKRKKNGSN